MKTIRIGWILFMMATAIAGCREEDVREDAAIQKQAPENAILPELPLLPPTALTADAGDGRAYLRWNLQLEDERVVGWRVVRINNEKRIMNEVLIEPATVVTGLENGREYVFTVVGVLSDGSLTPHSNIVSVTPRATGEAAVNTLPAGTKLLVGKREVTLGAFDAGVNPSIKIEFPDGQVLVYDRYRPVHWQTRDGEHLMCPEHIGNGLDIGRFDKRGLPVVIPPNGLTRTDMNVDDDRWTMMNPNATDYFSVRWQGFIRPRFSEKYTFHTLADDGVRLWVAGKQIIDRWVNQPPTEHTGSIDLEAGRKYEIRMEYYEYNGGATARLLWSSPNQPKEVVPAECLFPRRSDENGSGLEAFYCQNTGAVSPVKTRIDPAVDFSWDMGGPFGDAEAPRLYYQDAQFGSPHLFITDPMTLSLNRSWHQTRVPHWMGVTTDGDRVTVHYWQSIAMMGSQSWQRVLVWETWWPIEHDLHGTTYHGLARMVEVQMPSAWKTGYQVMLNNGFGPGGGSREGVFSYSTGFRSPGREIVDFSGPANRTVSFGSPGRPPRVGSMYHPNANSLQASPLIFYDWDRPDVRGSMLITARSLYYNCANASASCIEQGADGVWPNLAWDLARPGVRTYVDTVEYLYASKPEQPLPQRFVNARFWAYSNVSRRMGVQDRIAVVSDLWESYGGVKDSGGPHAYAKHYLEQVGNLGVDTVNVPFDLWVSVPIAADDDWRTDPAYRDNADISAMCRMFKDAGFKVGYWLRPEFLTTSIGSALSETIPSLPGDFFGLVLCTYPSSIEKLNQRGIPEFRENPDWARRQLDGSWPVKTPYEWVPMSLASGWHDRIMWPALKTTAEMGFSCVMIDGGFGGMQGVDYSPMLAGRADAALPMQPFWWRFWRTMEHVGIRASGECTTGWCGGNVAVGGPGDEHYAWMFQAGWYREKPATPRFLHQLYQLYNGTEFRPGDELLPVRRFAIEFNRKHPDPPDWVELVGLSRRAHHVRRWSRLDLEADGHQLPDGRSPVP